MNARMITVSVALGAALVGGMTMAGTASAWDPAPPKPPVSTATPTVPTDVHWVKCPSKMRRTGVACFRMSHR